jgi:hypothetical protein
MACKLKLNDNTTSKLGRLLCNGHQLLSHLGHLGTLTSKDWAWCSSTGYTYRNTYLQCVPTFLGGKKIVSYRSNCHSLPA